MNGFEAGIISGIPLGGIVGGVLCKSYGIFATIGGVIAGGVLGAFSGYLYSLLFIAFFAVFIAVWRGIRRLPDLTDEEQMAGIEAGQSTFIRGIFYGVVLAGVSSLILGWWSFIVAIVIALITAVVVTVQIQAEIKQNLTTKEAEMSGEA